jgi:hypothetical protein
VRGIRYSVDLTVFRNLWNIADGHVTPGEYRSTPAAGGKPSPFRPRGWRGKLGK